MTGNVTLVRPLDYDQNAKYTLVITAKNRTQLGLTSLEKFGSERWHQIIARYNDV
jgi:hypothetical protein